MDETTIGLEDFRELRSKGRRQKIIGAIRNTYAPGERVEPAHEVILRELIQRHPDLEGKLAGEGISHFEVQHCTHGTKCFYIVRSDGKRVDFSYKKCI